MPGGLFFYTKGVQRLLRDQQEKLIDYGDLIEYINEARRMVARRTMCLRFLTPIAGSISSANLITGGHGYTAPVLSITPPDFPDGTQNLPNGAQATGIITMNMGVITNVNITYGGAGYFQPVITVTDPHGTGATISPVLTYINTLNLGQEVYPFSMVDLTTAPPGFGSIYAVLSASVIFSDYRYILAKYDFTHYQALVRNYAFQFQYVPGICSQFGQGTAGSFYVYPQPDQTYQMEWDCMCDPADVLFPEDPDAIPDPWTDAVKFYAAYLAFMELGNYNAARANKDVFDNVVPTYGKAARPSRPINPYGRP